MMVKRKTEQKKRVQLKTVELVRSTYQPTKAEKCEEFQTDASVEQMADALLRPVNEDVKELVETIISDSWSFPALRP